MDNITSSLLFADGSAAALVVADTHPGKGIHIDHFYSEIVSKGKKDMAWELSSTGFQMTLSGYVPDLIEEDFGARPGRPGPGEEPTPPGGGPPLVYPSGGRKILGGDP